jgi:Txe/YoeB family toxin of Txe-Axe toxin-antitoxin module
MKIINLCIRTLPALYLSFTIASCASGNDSLESVEASNNPLRNLKTMTKAGFEPEKFVLNPRAKNELKEMLSSNVHEPMRNKFKGFLEQLSEAVNPMRGAEKLKGNLKGSFSLRLNQKNRLVYKIESGKIVIGSILNHY